MRTDFENLPELKPVTLHPSDANFLHRVPVQGERHGFLIFCTGSNPADGPDYTMADVAAFCRGWKPAE